MSVTPEAVIQVIEIGVLVGIFARMGRFGEAIEHLKWRSDRMEKHVFKGV